LKNKKTPNTTNFNPSNNLNNNSNNYLNNKDKSAKRSSSESGLLEKKAQDPKKSFLSSNSGVSPMKKTSSQTILDKQDNRKFGGNLGNVDIQLKNKIETELQRLKYYSNSLNKIKKRWKKNQYVNNLFKILEQ